MKRRAGESVKDLYVYYLKKMKKLYMCTRSCQLQSFAAGLNYRGPKCRLSKPSQFVIRLAGFEQLTVTLVFTRSESNIEHGRREFISLSFSLSLLRYWLYIPAGAGRCVPVRGVVRRKTGLC